jgi:phosphatidylinositol dimannoside acyltransferase
VALKAAPPGVVVAGYRGGAWLARTLPAPVVDAAVTVGSIVALRLVPTRARILRRHLERAHGHALTDREARRLVRRGFTAYGRYWAESFRLPRVTPAALDAGVNLQGYEHVARALAGKGCILVIPHLGQWEWIAFWLTQVLKVRITVVVEPVEPPKLREFFFDFRASLGMDIVTLGPDAGTQVLAAVHRGDLVCLLTDRDIEGNGVSVEFFGETTTLPAGAATLALRTGATLLPAAVYLGPTGLHQAVVKPPVPAERRDGFRADVVRVTQDIAEALEELITAAPEQWHLLQPNWPSDQEIPGVAQH